MRAHLHGVACAALASLLVSAPTLSQETASPAARSALAARIKRDSQRCEAHPQVDTCNDAIRWNPSDPALLVALGDAMLRAKRPADALRHYRLAAELAPKMPGLAARINSAEKRSAPRRAVAAARGVAPTRTPAAAATAPPDPRVAHTPTAAATPPTPPTPRVAHGPETTATASAPQPPRIAHTPAAAPAPPRVAHTPAIATAPAPGTRYSNQGTEAQLH